MGHAHGGSDAVAPLGLSGPAEADEHARVGGRLVGVVVVGQKNLLKPAVFAVVALWTQTAVWDTNAFPFQKAKLTHARQKSVHVISTLLSVQGQNIPTDSFCT